MNELGKDERSGREAGEVYQVINERRRTRHSWLIKGRQVK